MITRRLFLVTAASLPLVGCAAVLVTGVAGGSAAYYFWEDIANFYCRKISCDKGEVAEDDLRNIIRMRVEKTADLARKAGNDITKDDIEESIETEMKIAKRALRMKGIRVEPVSNKKPGEDKGANNRLESDKKP